MMTPRETRVKRGFKSKTENSPATIYQHISREIRESMATRAGFGAARNHKYIWRMMFDRLRESSDK